MRKPVATDDDKPEPTAQTVLADGSTDQTVTAAPRASGELPAAMRADLSTVSPGNYALEQEVGRGGMGRVMRATDTRHGRPVAIKEMIGGNADLLRRFEREALITSRLQHPSIVPVYEAGQWPDGSPFYAMKLVEGNSLSELLADRELDERLALLPKVLAVAEALAYAHSRGVIHRDLKPSNIIVGDYGETVVIDWGLAKQLDDDDDLAAQVDGGDGDGSLTRVGSVMGTPAFMPPEQAEGRGVDARSDVYALGAILYQLLAGAPPYVGRSSDAVLAQVMSEPPQPLNERVPGLPRDLLALVDKAMARNPAERYRDANELAAELRRFQTGQLVAAHSYTRGELFKRWMARNRAAVTVGAVLVAVLAIGGTLSVRQILQERDIARRERAAADDARRRAETARRAAVDQRSGAENLVDYMLVDLSERLRRDGKLDLLSGIAGKVKNYYADKRRIHVVDDREHNHDSRRFKQLMILGEVDLVKADVESARKQFRQALAIAEARRKQAGAGSDVALESARAERSLGRTLFELGKHRQAAKHYRRAVEVLAKLPATDKNAQAGMANGLAELGTSLFVQRDYNGALAAYQRSRAIARKLARAEPKNPRWRQLVGRAETRIADIHVQRGNYDAAIATLRKAEKTAQRAFDREPGNEVVRFGLGFVQFKLALALAQKGETKAALGRYARARDNFAAVLAAEPKFVRAKLFLAVTYSNVGHMHAAAKRFDKAIAETRKAVSLLEPITRANPTNAEWQVSLMSAYGNLAEWYALNPKHKQRAAGLARKAVAIAERLQRSGRLAPLHHKRLHELRKLANKLR